MNIAYLDCFSGASGDMLLGALLDVGLPLDDLRDVLASLPVRGIQLDAERTARQHITGTLLNIGSHETQPPLRTLPVIRRILAEGGLSDPVRERSLAVFEDLARVEGRIHDVPPEEIHFHEVGAVDSIVDVVGTVFGLERLRIGTLVVSPLPLGSGFVDSAHGRLPLPAPATVALLDGIPVYPAGIPFEMVTPTGAALLKNLATAWGAMPPMIIRSVGYGAGTRRLPDRPNLLRILMGQSVAAAQTETVVMLETNLDDVHPEWLGYLMERLTDAGALDVLFCPVQMKKNRPGVQVQVIGPPHRQEALLEVLLQETTALGVRFQTLLRRVLQREADEVDSPWGKLTVKKIVGIDGAATLAPEYEACREAALRHGRPLREIYAWVAALNQGKAEARGQKAEGKAFADHSGS